MARVNINDDLEHQVEFRKLVPLVDGDWYRALGKVVVFLRLAQKAWVAGVPLTAADLEAADIPEMIPSGWAKPVEGGYTYKDADIEFAWLKQRSDAGKKSARSRSTAVQRPSTGVEPPALALAPALAPELKDLKTKPSSAEPRSVKGERKKYHVPEAYPDPSPAREALLTAFPTLAGIMGPLLAECDRDHRAEFPAGQGFTSIDHWVRRRMNSYARQLREGWGIGKPGMRPEPEPKKLEPPKLVNTPEEIIELGISWAARQVRIKQQDLESDVTLKPEQRQQQLAAFQQETDRLLRIRLGGVLPGEKYDEYFAAKKGAA